MASADKANLSRLRLSPEEKQASTGRRRILLIGLGVGFGVLLIVAAAVSVSNLSSGEESEPERPSEGLPQGAPPRSASHVAAGGYVEAKRTASVLPGRDGVVAAIHIKLGQTVEEGALLLELESRTETAEVEMAQAEVEVARSKLRRVRSGSRTEEVEAARADAEASEAAWQESRRNLERLETLLPQGATAAADVERARHRELGAAARLKASRAREQLLRRGSRQADVLGAEAELARAEAAQRRAEARLEVSRLRAPFSGTVASIETRLGEVVSLQSSVGGIEVADLSELWVRVDVPETRIGRVRLGDLAEVVVDALGEGNLEATVVGIAPLADRQSNTVEVAVRISEPPPLIRPNMSARVSIEASGGLE